jgi:transcriptional regulator with XRE-family HTH domain
VRKEKGLTQQKLAEEADLHLTYVAHLEYGKYHPTVFVLWKIAKALGVTLNDLTHG